MGKSWVYVWMIIFVLGCTIGLRVLMEVFCAHTDRKMRLLCVAGMMVCYTLVVAGTGFRS